MLYVYWLHTEVIILIHWVKYIIFYKKEPKNKASLVAQTVKHLSTMQETWVGKIPWRRKWQPTPVFLPGKSHGLWSLVGYCPWGRKESDTTEWVHFHFEEQGREEWAVEGAGARSPRILPFSSPCPVLSLNGEQRPSSTNSHSQSPPASASRGAAERTSPGRSWWMTVPLGGDPRLEWLTKGVIGAAGDNSGFSEHLACAWPERRSSPTSFWAPLLAQEGGQWLGGDRGFFLWAPGSQAAMGRLEPRPCWVKYLAYVSVGKSIPLSGLIKTGWDDLEGVFQL